MSKNIFFKRKGPFKIQELFKGQESKSLKITDIKGRLVQDFDLVDGINTINLVNISQGNYFFSVGNKTFKIVKAAN